MRWRPGQLILDTTCSICKGNRSADQGKEVLFWEPEPMKMPRRILWILVCALSRQRSERIFLTHFPVWSQPFQDFGFIFGFRPPFSCHILGASALITDFKISALIEFRSILLFASAYAKVSIYIQPHQIPFLYTIFFVEIKLRFHYLCHINIMYRNTYKKQNEKHISPLPYQHNRERKTLECMRLQNGDMAVSEFGSRLQRRKTAKGIKGWK